MENYNSIDGPVILRSGMEKYNLNYPWFANPGVETIPYVVGLNPQFLYWP